MLLMAGIALIAIVSGAGCADGESPIVNETPQVAPSSTPTPEIVATSTPVRARIAPTATSIPVPSGVVGPASISPATRPPAEGFSPPNVVEGVGQATEMQLGEQVFRLEIARTRDERARGLMDRESLPADAAMLFVFETESPLAFWMKNTLIPLDILYLGSAGIVIDIQTMLPEPGVADSELRRYPSAAPARYAVEMNAGLADMYDFDVGDQVYFR